MKSEKKGPGNIIISWFRPGPCRLWIQPAPSGSLNKHLVLMLELEGTKKRLALSVPRPAGAFVVSEPVAQMFRADVNP